MRSVELIKEGSRLTRENLSQLIEGESKLTRELIKRESQMTMEILDRMDRKLDAIYEARARRSS